MVEPGEESAGRASLALSKVSAGRASLALSNGRAGRQWLAAVSSGSEDARQLAKPPYQAATGAALTAPVGLSILATVLAPRLGAPERPLARSQFGAHRTPRKRRGSPEAAVGRLSHADERGRGSRSACHVITANASTGFADAGVCPGRYPGRSWRLHIPYRARYKLPSGRSANVRQLPCHARGARELAEIESPCGGNLQHLPHAPQYSWQVRDQVRKRLSSLSSFHTTKLARTHPDETEERCRRAGQLSALSPRADRPPDGRSLRPGIWRHLHNLSSGRWPCGAMSGRRMVWQTAASLPAERRLG